MGFLAIGVPQATVGAAATPPRQVTIIITDSGFEKQDYTAGFSGSTASDQADIIFVNKGTVMHTAQTVPGSPDLGATFGAATDPLGGARACWANGAACGKLMATNTGGIPPNGGTVTLGFMPIMTSYDYTLSSGPDCIYGSNPTFNCTPVMLHLVSIAARSPISGTMGGTVFRPAGSTDCDTTISAIVPPVGDPFCYSSVRDPGTILGSPTKPQGDTTVTINDITGFNPTILYVKDGSNVTWVNKGSRVHGLTEKPTGSAPYNGFDFLGPVGLGPGETYTYNFHTYPGWRKLKGNSISNNVTSMVNLDLIPKAAAGGNNLLQGCKSIGVTKTKAARFQQECGQPGLLSKVIVIPTASSGV